jgi:hypothetical protein
MWTFDEITKRQGQAIPVDAPELWMHTHFETAAPAVLALGTTDTTTKPTPIKRARKGSKKP